MTYLSGTVSEVSSAPAASIGRWAADQVAPSYWRPNADIINCHYCTKRFDTTDKIHHCRACGEGFCSTCSSMKFISRGNVFYYSCYRLPEAGS